MFNMNWLCKSERSNNNLLAGEWKAIIHATVKVKTQIGIGWLILYGINMSNINLINSTIIAPIPLYSISRECGGGMAFPAQFWE